MCLSVERQKKLIATPPEALLEGDFLALASSVGPDPPIEPNAKALVPRAFELLARGDSTSGYADQLFFLSPCQWRKWQPAEVEAIEQFCASYLEAAARWSAEDGLDSESVIITLAELGYDWPGHVRGWIAGGTPGTLANLLKVADQLESGKVRPSGFWASVPEAAHELTQILRAPATLAALESVLLEDRGDPRLMSWLSALHKYLEDGAPGSLADHTYALQLEMDDLR